MKFSSFKPRNAVTSFAHRAFGLPRRNRINLVSRPPNTGRAAGVPIYTAPNTPEEFRRLRIAAQADDVEAVNALGIALTFGQGCTADPVEAVKWYRAAALQGHPQAQCHLGHSYLTAAVVKRDLSAAEAWFGATLLPGQVQQELRQRDGPAR